MTYILFLCLYASNRNCITASFPDLKQCENAAKVFERRMMNCIISTPEWYCQQVRNK